MVFKTITDIQHRKKRRKIIRSLYLFWLYIVAAAAAKSLQSCPTLFDPMDSGLPGSSVHGTLQARTLEWVVMPSSRGSSRPRDPTWVTSDSLLYAWGQIILCFEIFFGGGAILSIERCQHPLPLASTHQMLVSNDLLVMTIKNISRCSQISPRG